MIGFEHILVPFEDNEQSISAMVYAAMFASGTGAKITALHLADPKDYSHQHDFKLELTKMVDERLRPRLLDIQKTYPEINTISIRTLGLTKPIPKHIIAFARENEIDCIIMRSHGLPYASNLEMRFKKTNAYQVALESLCPVFTFTEYPKTNGLKSILLPLDLSDGSLYKVPVAIDLAQRFDAKIHLLSASEHREDDDELEEQMVEISKELKRRGLKVGKHAVQRETLPDAIALYCDQISIDLVIIMSRPAFRWSDLWMSPSAKKIIAQSKVPVLSIRSSKPIEIGL